MTETRFTQQSLYEALASTCAHRDLPIDRARLLHHYSTAVWLLPDVDVVVRMTTSRRTADAVEATQALVARIVRDHAFPATEPRTDIPPVRADAGVTASFWRYHPQPDRPFTPDDLPRLLRHLHDLPQPDVVLPMWEPLCSLREELARPEPVQGLRDSEARWLRETVEDVTEELKTQSWQLGNGLIHGDAWAGNLLFGRIGAILGDWDNVAVGPREIDLIPTWHAAQRYGRDWTDGFINSYGHDLAEDPAYDLLLRMRDLVQLTGPLRRAGESSQHHAVLRQRFEAIQAGDRTSQWLAL